MRIRARQGRQDFAAAVDDFNLGLAGLDRPGAVEHNQVGALAFQLLQGPHPLVLGLQGEGDDPLVLLDRTAEGDDIGSLDQVQLQRTAGLRQLVRGDADRAVVAGRGRADQAIAGRERIETGLEHLFGRDHRHDLDGRRIGHVDRPADDQRFVPRCQASLRQGMPIRPLEALVR